ncbi:MAG TPA: aldo/keto reductase [Armatimonadaceae bacterium]|nr:aldo/keto reductase [Armatimonadaceae bacterium]
MTTVSTTVPTVTLGDGRAMPQLGFGLWQVPDEEARAAVDEALAAGYRSFDSAKIYGNEKGLGDALAATDVPREELFVTTKLWNDEQGYDSALRAFDDSLERLGLDYVDLYLIHWPSPHRNLYAESWKALVRIKQEGRARSVGVSNFTEAHLRRILDETGETPALNQVELHPHFQQRALREFHAARGIATESWSPLGQGKLLDDRAITEIAAKHGKTPAQVVLRWHLDSGLITIPKSVTPSRIRENIRVFDFALDGDDMERIAALDDPAGGRIGSDPDTATF